MDAIELKPGMRVRCVDPGDFAELRRGIEYEVSTVRPSYYGCPMVGIVGVTGWEFVSRRFKPVVRVKAPVRVSFDLLVKRAKAALDKMTPEQQARHWQEQRESWVRGEMELGRLGHR